MDLDTLSKCLESQVINVVLAMLKLNNEVLKMLDIMCRHKRALAAMLAVNQTPHLIGSDLEQQPAPDWIR